MRKWFVKSNQKYSTKKAIKTYFSWQESLLLSNNHHIWSTLLLNMMEQKNGKERSGFGWVLLFFQWKNWPQKKYKNQQSNLPLGPPNALTLEETKENHAACLWQ